MEKGFDVSPIADSGAVAEPFEIEGTPQSAPACAACGASLQGDYCHDCGQMRMERDHFTVGYLLGEAFREATSLDGKLWSSVRLLYLKPGLLVTDYLDGRGTLHFGPVKLFLLSLTIYFFLAPYTVLSPEQIRHMASQFPAGPASEFFARMQARMESGAFFDTYQTVYTLMLGLTVFFSAAVLKLAFRKRLYGEHLVFALYELSFVFLTILPISLFTALVRRPELSLAATVVVLAAYFVWVLVALRRVYRSRWANVLLFALFYLLIREILDTAVAAGAIVYSAL